MAISTDSPTRYAGVRQEPVAVHAAILAVANLLVAFRVVSLDASQIGALNVAIGALLGLRTRQRVTPLRNPKTAAGVPLHPAR